MLLVGILAKNTLSSYSFVEIIGICLFIDRRSCQADELILPSRFSFLQTDIEIFRKIAVTFIDFEDFPAAYNLSQSLVIAGKSLAAMKQWDQALKALKTAMLVSGEFAAEASRNLANYYRELGDIESALDYGLDAVSLDNQSPGAYTPLALAYQKKGHLEKACEMINKALFYEAPWDEDNKEKNLRLLQEFRTEQRREEKRQKQEEAFIAVWGKVFANNPSVTGGHASSYWQSIHDKFNVFTGDVEDDPEIDPESLRETVARLDAATASSLVYKGDLPDDVTEISEGGVPDDEDIIVNRSGVKTTMQASEGLKPEYDRIRFTKDVVKWRDACDPRFRMYFERRIRQLALGDRSRILSKRLTGSKNTTIYETYLEQKSGFRILWTEDQKGLLIWYVSTHDKVSDYMRRIDKSEERSSRQLVSAASIQEKSKSEEDTDTDFDLRENEVMLDPRGDTPLKVYVLRYHEIPLLTSETWRPPLHLTTEERQIVEKEGNVLLLGRSGTGKVSLFDPCRFHNLYTLT